MRASTAQSEEEQGGPSSAYSPFVCTGTGDLPYLWCWRRWGQRLCWWRLMVQPWRAMPGQCRRESPGKAAIVGWFGSYGREQQLGGGGHPRRGGAAQGAVAAAAGSSRRRPNHRHCTELPNPAAPPTLSAHQPIAGLVTPLNLITGKVSQENYYHLTIMVR